MSKNIKISGVYIISSVMSKKHYVGESGNTKKRLSKHLSYLRSNVHPNKHLQESFKKYGENNFTFELLLECEERLRKSEENFWCNMLNTHDPKYGYNKLPTGPNGHTSHSEETKEKMSKLAKGRGKGIKRGPFTEEHRRNLSESKKGNTAFKGKKHSPEAIEKLRSIHKGKMYHPPIKHSEETKKKLSDMKKGKLFSESHKEALRQARKKAHENKIKLGKI